MSNRIRETAADVLHAFNDYGRGVLATVLIGAAAFIVVRTMIVP